MTSSPAPVVSLIKGGLGNQMFCYATGRALALRHGRELQIDVLTGFQRDVYERSFRLNRFPIVANEATKKLSLGGDTRSWSHKFTRFASKWSKPSSRNYLTEKDGATPAALASLKPAPHKPIYLNGYWQDEAYFADAADRIRKELAPPVPTSEAALEARRQILSSPMPVMLHVRRVRYSPRLDADYYIDAVAHCLAHFPNATFFVFGDDFEWAKKNLTFHDSPVHFLEHVGADEIEDLHLMTCCRHAIVANSSFSWWGAWLGHHPGQEVWTPLDPGWPVKPAAGWKTLHNKLEV